MDHSSMMEKITEENSVNWRKPFPMLVLVDIENNIKMQTYVLKSIQ